MAKQEEVKTPRRIQVAINQLNKQREKAEEIRRKVVEEIAQIDAALLPLMKGE